MISQSSPIPVKYNEGQTVLDNATTISKRNKIIRKTNSFHFVSFPFQAFFSSKQIQIRQYPSCLVKNVSSHPYLPRIPKMWTEESTRCAWEAWKRILEYTVTVCISTCNGKTCVRKSEYTVTVCVSTCNGRTCVSLANITLTSNYSRHTLMFDKEFIVCSEVPAFLTHF